MHKPIRSRSSVHRPQTSIRCRTLTPRASVSGSSTASLGAGALAHVSGNVGVNIVSGAGNVQSNALVVH